MADKEQIKLLNDLADKLKIDNSESRSDYTEEQKEWALEKLMKFVQKQIEDPDVTKRVCYYHSKDMDGFFSGAVVKYKYPDIELRGWDYKDPVPSYNDIKEFDEVIMIDVTFPLNTILEYIKEGAKFTIIDHHVSFKKQVEAFEDLKIDINGRGGVESITSNKLPFEYIYDNKLAACEVGFQHYFKRIPPIVEVVGDYDTWRSNKELVWERAILPIQYFMKSQVSKPEDVQQSWFEPENDYTDSTIDFMVEDGKVIQKYEKVINKAKTETYGFTVKMGKYNALCLNTGLFSSDIVESLFDPILHDIMVGFVFDGTKWSASLRSIEGGVDVSEIAREKGGGGHKHAARFEVENFEDIWK